MRIKSIFLGVAAFAMTGVLLSAQDGGDKTSLTLDFNASAVSVNSDGDVDSFADTGFGEDNESTLSFSYEGEFFGGTASLGFGPQSASHIDGELAEMLGEKLFSLDELYVWIKPFGPNFKFTGGVFENTDGIGDYTDDLDNFGMGAFLAGEAGDPFGDPGTETGVGLANGFLVEAAFAPVTVQLLLGPNFSKASADDLFNTSFGYLGMTPIDIDSRFFHAGGRIIADIGVGTISALFKTSYWPMSTYNALMQMSLPEGGDDDPPWTPFAGTAANNMTFGAYIDITAVENLGISLGYTGFMSYSDADDVDNVLWNGIDLRAQYTGIPGLSISTHHNVSFAQGAEKEWLGWLQGDDSSFFSLYNAVGVTKELTEQFSINAEIGNVFVKMKSEQQIVAIYGTPGDVDYDTFWGQAKLVVSPVENAAFSIGLRFEGAKQDDEDLTAVFSVPIGITVSF
ncbi:MAG: hypothetical protein LBL76_05030 [Treponema sp.]|jgi:hypothetical protein|nr:hypothetical protein [Treponema sp.]